MVIIFNYSSIDLKYKPDISPSNLMEIPGLWQHKSVLNVRKSKSFKGDKKKKVRDKSKNSEKKNWSSKNSKRKVDYFYFL